MPLVGKRKEIIDEARTWLGTPFGPGYVKGVSVHCLGLVVGVLENCGLPEPANRFRPFMGHVVPIEKHVMITELNDFFPERSPHNYRIPGDIMLFNFGNGPKHCAFVSTNGCIIHSHNIHGKCVEHLLPPSWRPVVIYRLPIEN